MTPDGLGTGSRIIEEWERGVRHAFDQANDAGMPWDGGCVFTTYEHCELPDLFSWVAGGDYEEAVREEIRDCLVEKTHASRWWAKMEPDEAFSCRGGAARPLYVRPDRERGRSRSDRIGALSQLLSLPPPLARLRPEGGRT